MKQAKYIMSHGLVFSEEKDMEKLRRFSLKGWHVSGFSFMGYTLEKGESSDYIYSVDYHPLKENDSDEYFELFSASGWSHVASADDIHLFRAYPGTNPIYTDHETTIEKYKRSSGSLMNLVIPLAILTALVWGIAMVSSDTLQSVLNVVAIVLSIIFIPIIWTVMTTYQNQWKAQGRKGLVNLLNVIPVVLLFISASTLLLADGLDLTVKILASMIVGAVGFPVLIWAIKFIYRKLSGR